MRLSACVVVVVFALTSCVGGRFTPPPPAATLPQVSLTAPVTTFLAFNDTTPLALLGAAPVVPLFAIPDIETNQGRYSMTLWGTKDGAGAITQLTEAGIKGPNGEVHVFFDTSERPIYLRDDASGYALAIAYDSPTQQTITLCDPSGTADAFSQLTESNGGYQASDAADGGSCRLTSAAAVTRIASGSTLAAGVPTDLSSLSSLSKIITAASSIAGLSFSISAILKFKQHKDNPTQVPIGTPIALVFIAAALLFLPTVLGATGSTMFGDYAQSVSIDDLAEYLSESSLLGCATASSTCPFPSPEPTP